MKFYNERKNWNILYQNWVEMQLYKTLGEKRKEVSKCEAICLSALYSKNLQANL